MLKGLHPFEGRGRRFESDRSALFYAERSSVGRARKKGLFDFVAVSNWKRMLKGLHHLCLNHKKYLFKTCRFSKILGEC